MHTSLNLTPPAAVQANLILLLFTDIMIFINWGFVAALGWARLLGSFSQQHLLTLWLWVTFCEFWQYFKFFSLSFVTVIWDHWYLMLLLKLFWSTTHHGPPRQPWWWRTCRPVLETGDTGPIPGLGKSSGGGHGSPLQYSCLENPVDRGPGGLQPTGSQRVGHNWSDFTHTHTPQTMPYNTINWQTCAFWRLYCWLAVPPTLPPPPAWNTRVMKVGQLLILQWALSVQEKGRIACLPF